MQPVIYFRARGLELENELETARKYFPVVRYRSDVPPNSLVIGRYSVLPEIDELAYDLAKNGSILINPPRQHRWISGFIDYYEIFQDITPRSWREHEMPYCTHPGPFVLKGATNSRKHLWKTHMYAETKKDAFDVASRLAQDELIGPQGIIYREYVPLVTYEYGLYNLPYTNEWRFFAYKGQILSYGYYWVSASRPDLGVMDGDGLDLANWIATVACEHVDFVCFDIAQKQDGGWILIELNDPQMSGLSNNDPDKFYSALATAIKAESL